MKNLKKVIAVVLCLITVFSVMSISASAARVSAGTAKTSTSATYTIKNSGSGKMLNVYGSKSASNTNVTIYQSDGTKGQKCKFISNGTTTYNKVSYNKYIIEFACAPSCALNVYGSAAANNSNVNIWKKSGNTTQAWILEYVTSPAKGYIIRSANNPKYVLTANGTSNSSNVCLKTYSSTNKNQVWTCSAFSYSTKNTTSSGNSTTNSASSKTLRVDMSIIKKTGYQPKSGPCGCYALAYCRDIIDNKYHSWTEYSKEGYVKAWGRYGYTVNWSKGSFTSKTGATKLDVLKSLYNSINNGKPAVVRVKGNGSTGHYVAVVGYKDVKDINSLTEKNFLIIDSASKTAFKRGITSMTSGSTGYSIHSNRQYVIAK